MKKFALLFAVASVVASANAVTPEGAVYKAKQQYEFGQVANQMSDFGLKVKSGISPKLFNSSIRKAEEKDPLKVKYALPSGTMTIGLATDGSYALHTYRLAPAYTPLTFTNLSKGYTECEWEYWGPNYTEEDPDYQYSNDQNLTVSYPGFSYVQAPTLFATGEDGSDSSYAANYEYMDYKIGGGNLLNFSDGKGGSFQQEMGVMTDMNTLRIMVEDYNNKVPEDDERSGFYYWPQYGYFPSNDDNNPTTGLEQQFQDYIYSSVLEEETPTSTLEFAGFGAKFPQPQAAYSISQLWMRFYYQPKKNTTVECNLYKIDEDGKITDELLASGVATIQRVLGATGATVVFDLYSVDEDGLATDDPIIIDCPFIAMMEFNAADFTMVCPIAGDGEAVADRADYPPYNNYILVKVNGELVPVENPWTWTLNDGSGYMFVNDWCCMIDAKYTWMLPGEGSSLTQTVPAEGGEVTFAVDSYYNLYYFIANGLCFTNEPDDLELTDFVNDEETNLQLLTVKVAPLPEGVTGRELYLEFDETQFVGCPNLLTIQQGENGVNIISTNGDVKYFDLAGRQVANPDKGVYIKVSGNKTEKVIL